MLIGEYSYAIDDKGRLNFPPKFREAMGGTFIVTRWLDDCLVGAHFRTSVRKKHGEIP